MDIPLPIHLRPLAKLLEKEDPRVLVLVGTGVSIGATSAPQTSWLGLLKHGVDYLVEKGKFTTQYGYELKADLDSAFLPFDLDKALEHAENVQHSLSILKPEDFADWLHISFSDLKAQIGETGTLEAIRDLQQAGALILTTNYDSLLSKTTGLPPATWNNPKEFLKAYHEKNRILHIHGHWQHPESIILGKRSYDRIVGEEAIQSLLKTIWLDWTWVYVGCGDGIEDPNLGLLLNWGKQWGDSALKHYFFAKLDKAVALESRTDKPANLVSVPFDEYSDLPKILHSITPTARCFPFVLIDEQFRLFRDPNSSPLNDPFPSRQEYLDGEVPKLETDDEVINRLEKHGWAFVLDVASVGKTTLALRIATSTNQQKYPVYYLDFASIDIENASEDITSALTRLSKQNVLLIFDNSHYQPELVRQLWDQWRDKSRGSKLLIIATRTQQHVKTSPSQDFISFEKHKTNPVIELSPTENDLKNILNRLYLRVFTSRIARLKTSIPTRLDPPLSSLREWHKVYGKALGAFCLAVLGQLSELERGNWELSISTVADWVKEKWLNNLDSEYLENLLCLSVFGSQELELNVYKEALPYPEKTQLLMNKGLVTRTDIGKLGQYHLYALREPGWGSLILTTQSPAVDEESMLFTCASRDPRMLIAISSRLKSRNINSFKGLWYFISQHPDRILQVYDYPLDTFLYLLRYAEASQQLSMVNQLWDAIESDFQKLVGYFWETPFHNITSFIVAAENHKRDIGLLWRALESQPFKLAERAWVELDFVRPFLALAKRHQRNVDLFWEAIESDPQKLVECVRNRLDKLGPFIEFANEQKRDTDALWKVIESEPQIVEHPLETSLNQLGSFLKVAKKYDRNVDVFWMAIESEPEKFAERVWNSDLGNVAGFLAIVRKHERNIDLLCRVLENEPKKMSSKARKSNLISLSGFCKQATDSLVEIILDEIMPN